MPTFRGPMLNGYASLQSRDLETKKMRCVLVSVLLAAALPAFSAEVVVGQSAPLTGGNAELGNDIRNGALAWFEKVNKAGGLPQGKLKLVTLDDRNDAKLAAQNTDKLLDEYNAVALFG